MKTLTLVIKGRLPSLNEFIDETRKNKFISASVKKKYTKTLGVLFRVQAKGVTFKNHVLVYIRFYEENRKRDDDNVFSSGSKYIMDGLQEAGIIINDSPKYCHVMPEVFHDRQSPRIEVEIIESDEKMR